MREGRGDQRSRSRSKSAQEHSTARKQPHTAYRQNNMRLKELDGSLHYLTVDQANCANAAADKMAAKLEETIPTWQISTSGDVSSADHLRPVT